MSQNKNFLCQRNSPLKWKSGLGLFTSTVEWCDHQFHSKLLGIVCNVICQNERTQLSALHPLHTRIYSLMTATASGMLGYHIPTFSPNGFSVVLSKLTSWPVLLYLINISCQHVMKLQIVWHDVLVSSAGTCCGLMAHNVHGRK